MTQTVEEWRRVPGHDDAYEASNLGCIRSLQRLLPKKNSLDDPCWFRGHEDMGHVTLHGHRAVELTTKICGNREYRKGYTVASIIAAAFFGPRPEGYVTHHIDGDLLDDCVDNLVYIPRGLLSSINLVNRPGHCRAEVVDRVNRELEAFVAMKEVIPA